LQFVLSFLRDVQLGAGAASQFWLQAVLFPVAEGPRACGRRSDHGDPKLLDWPIRGFATFFHLLFVGALWGS